MAGEAMCHFGFMTCFQQFSYGFLLKMIRISLQLHIPCAYQWHQKRYFFWSVDHVYVCDLQSMIHMGELPKGYRWNHVEVIKSNGQEMKSGRDQFHFALHVYKQQNNPETIQFMNPRTIYADSNLWQRVQPQDLEELEDDTLYQGLFLRLLMVLSGPKYKLDN